MQKLPSIIKKLVHKTGNSKLFIDFFGIMWFHIIDCSKFAGMRRHLFENEMSVKVGHGGYFMPNRLKNVKSDS